MEGLTIKFQMFSVAASFTIVDVVDGKIDKVGVRNYLAVRGGDRCICISI